MTILFTQHWDVIPGKFDEYAQFVTNEYNPTLERIGLKLLGGYYVAVGSGPRIVAVSTIEEKDYLRKILATRDYRTITAKLVQLVYKYSSKLWVLSGHVTEGPYSIQMGAWKFNQYYNIVPGKEEAHYHFVKDECIPGMKQLQAPITGGWRLVIGDGPLMLAECSAKSMEAIAKCIDSDLFRRLVRKLKKEYATDYASRILAPTGRIEIPSLLSQMMKGF